MWIFLIVVFHEERKKNTQKSDRDGYTRGKKNVYLSGARVRVTETEYEKLVHRYCCA
jgi:hypothetical protein